MSDETDRRIEAARAEQRRQKETKEFLDSLTSKDSLVRPIYNPEAWAIRNKARGQANRGEITKTDCRHPFAYLQQYEDDDPSVKRKGLPVNLFLCGICGMPLWLVDPFGNEKSDG